MHYNDITRAIFLSRPNRFIAHVDLDGAEMVVHVKNTGRCRELLVPGTVVYLEKGTTPGRKTPYDLVSVEKGERLVNMDAQAPNRAFAEFAQVFDPAATAVHSEVVYGQSRLDFCLETPTGLHYVEVKGVTLENDGHVTFPDAPTDRGTRHLHELMHAVEEGHRATVFFVVQMENVRDFGPNELHDPAFSAALRQAAQAGVGVAAYECHVTPQTMEITRAIPVIL